METDQEKEQKYSVLMIPVVVANGIVSGLVSVITAYFFKPLWLKITKLWDKNKDQI